MLCALLCALLCGCRQPEAQQPIHWQAGPPGFELAQLQVGAGPDRPTVQLHMVRIDLQRYQLQVVTAAEMGLRLAGAPAFRERVHGLAAVNGGYFDPDYKPLGLLVSQGRELSHLRQVDHGVFAVAGGRALLDHARTFHAPPDLEFAVECGPRLLVAGQAPHFRRTDVARRVAIGLDAAGRVLLAVSDGVLTLDEFARSLAQPEPGGPGLRDVLNLDGGSSAMLDVAAGPLRAQVATALEVPIGIAVAARPPRGP